MGNREIKAARTETIRSLHVIDSALKEVETARRWGLGDLSEGGLFRGLTRMNKIRAITRSMAAVKKQLTLTDECLKRVEGQEDITLCESINDPVFEIRIDKNSKDTEIHEYMNKAYRLLKKMEFTMTKSLNRQRII